MSTQHTPAPWVRHNPLTDTYDTPDGTTVAAELCDNAESMADVMHIATVREEQRGPKATGRKSARCGTQKCGEFNMLRCAYEAGHTGDHCYVVDCGAAS